MRLWHAETVLEGDIGIIPRGRCLDVYRSYLILVSEEDRDLLPIGRSGMEFGAFGRMDPGALRIQDLFRFRAGHTEAKAKKLGGACELFKLRDLDLILGPVSGWLEIADEAIVEMPRVKPFTIGLPALEGRARDGDQEPRSIGVSAAEIGGAEKPGDVDLFLFACPAKRRSWRRVEIPKLGGFQACTCARWPRRRTFDGAQAARPGRRLRTAVGKRSLAPCKRGADGDYHCGRDYLDPHCNFTL